MKRKWLAIGIILLFIGTAIIPASGQKIEKSLLPTSRGNWLYVGGSGPGNYTKIQDAVNISSDGDTVYVYDDSSPYIENVVVDKSIHLIGEEKNTTIVDGSRKGDVIYVKHDNVTISGFSIINSEDLHPRAGLTINGNYTTISDNILKNNYVGIASVSIPYPGSYSLAHNVIMHNIVSQSRMEGIWLDTTKFSIVTNNIIFDNGFSGINTNNAVNNSVSGNKLINNKEGLTIFTSIDNKIFLNNITHSEGYGIFISDSKDNNISQNNIIDNGKRNAFFLSLLKYMGRNSWDGNYWDNPRQYFYPILGRIALQEYIEIGIIPWFQFDWHPAKEPYDIPGMR